MIRTNTTDTFYCICLCNFMSILKYVNKINNQ